MQRVRLIPKSYKARRAFNARLKDGAIMYVDNRNSEKWFLKSEDNRMELWVYPRNDPDWDVLTMSGKPVVGEYGTCRPSLTNQHTL